VPLVPLRERLVGIFVEAAIGAEAALQWQEPASFIGYEASRMREQQAFDAAQQTWHARLRH
jgi:hypothetical protein